MTTAFPLMLMMLAAPDQAPPGLMMLALQGGEAVPLLELSRPTNKDGTEGPFSVVYWAGTDSDALSSAAGREMEHARAQRVFEAFRVWGVTNAIYDIAVSAVAGGPGGRSRLLRVKWTRTGPQTWGKGDPSVRELTLPKFTTESRPGNHDKSIEAGTVASALAFVSKLDAKRFREAWDGASAQFRASAPWEDFDRALQMAAKMYGPVSSRKPIAWMYPATGAPADGALVMVRFVTITDGGEGVEDVTVRLEPGKVWRVAGYTPKARVPDERRNLLPAQVQDQKPGTYTIPLPPAGK
jgi:hypothetical protein